MADLILDLLDKRKLHGRIEITVDDNLPANVEWQKKLLSSLPENPGSKTIDLEDGTRVSASLQAQTGKQMDFDKLVLESQERKTPHQHMAFAGSTEGDKAVNVTVFKIKSVSKDTYIKSTLKDLRKASSQFSGTRPGAIFCFFKGIQFI